MKVNLHQKLSATLTLTPQLQQAIRLLQLSAFEIDQELSLAAEQNPFLDYEPAIREEQLDPITGFSHRTSSTKLHKIDAYDLEEFSTLSYQETLLEHLMQQIGSLRLPADVQKILYYLAGCVDEKGYLRDSIDDLLEGIHALFLDESSEDLQKVLEIALLQLKQLDPPGIGAQTLSECLTLQLKALSNVDQNVMEAALALVRDHLDDLGKANLEKIKQKLRLKDGVFVQTVKLIKSLNPSPGLQYTHTPNEIITPDVLIKRVNKKWVAVLNPSTQPNLRLRTEYMEITKDLKNTPENAPFLEQLNEAKVLVRSVKQRGDTILRVAQAIVEKQQGFFDHGDLAMQPLLLKEIAETLDLHESTISRVTNQKFLQSNRGTFAFKYFFGGQIGKSAGESISSKAIQTLIKQMIQSESPTKPLSDGDISALLNHEGYQIARRTIVKYREILQIPPVQSRKKMNAAL